MKNAFAISLVMGSLMVCAGALSRALTPTIKIADQQAKFSLGALIPPRFGDWQIDTTVLPLQVDPEVLAKLDRVYNQTLVRTYVNAAGDRVMLSIAYGGDQSDSMAVHKPEVCYVAQGFNVSSVTAARIDTGFGALPVRRLTAVSGARNEPITYWSTVGEHAATSMLNQKLLQINYGLRGQIPDGILVRVSSLNTDTPAAHRTQDRFIAAMLHGMTAQGRLTLAGAFGE